ncbi:DUF1801 domain-containing protein [uncultured Ferrimonas sp.]|uniref:DUF1801 domain-containing protein n=1 Tax=uncultured Ferrimonas sp. TaxID=432640 RepID=UPI00262ED7ED|nr:DUF1801 domain-containing protein [uncultured Ferrimonas sp.]
MASSNKNQANDMPVADYLAQLSDERQQQCQQLSQWMSAITGETAVMWGTSIVGFGQYHYRTDAGRSGRWLLTGFSSRKQALTVYLMGGVEQHHELLQQLGPYQHGVSCLYIKALNKVDNQILQQIIAADVAALKQRHGS